METDRPALQLAILDRMGGSGESFEPLALRTFHHQFVFNTPYRAYCETLGRTPESVSSWTEIPPVPAEVFKSGLHLACFPPTETIRSFLTSGTSSEIKGEHHFRDLVLYEAAIQHGWKHAGLPPLQDAYFTSRPPEESPHSSLAHMFRTLSPDQDPQRWLATPDGGFELSPLAAASNPLVLFGTTLSLLHLCNSTPPQALPPGSHVFHTGGFKGVTSAHDPHQVVALISKHFQVPEDHIIHEYGMTELSSQCYAMGRSSLFQCPPWMRVQVIDPATNSPVAAGETGYLVLHDLANLDSVASIRTRDFAQAIDHSSFHLLGRDPAALPRGCSRASDAFFQSSP